MSMSMSMGMGMGRATGRPSGAAVGFTPRTEGQARLVDALRSPASRLLVVRGPAGCGKSMFSMQEALRDLEGGRVRKVLLVRPTVACDESLGFLPGDIDDKLGPWMLPFRDAVGDLFPESRWARWGEEGRLEVCALGMVRGRTLRHSWVVADKMQNATPRQVRALLTRIGEGSRMALLGDPAQSDLPADAGPNGLEDLWRRLDGQGEGAGPVPPEVGRVELGVGDIQRDPLVAYIERLYGAGAGGPCEKSSPVS